MITSINSNLRRFFTLLTLGVFLNVTFLAPAMAGMVTSSELSSAAQVEQLRDEIRTVIARDDIRSHLLDNGVSPDDINDRINTMTGSEVLAMHAQLDSLPAGEGFLGGVIAVIVIFILLDLAGVTDVFPGV